MFLDDPRRKPLWRYERAVAIVTNFEAPHPRFDDDIVRILRDFTLLREKLVSQGKSERMVDETLRHKFPILWKADRIFANGRTDRTRYGLEAYILTGAPFERIADSMAIETPVVDMYEKCFFHVTDRLKAKNYIASEVLGNAFMAGLVNKSQETTAKYFAYFGGEMVLDIVLDAFSSGIARPTDAVGLMDWIDDSYKLRLRTQGLIGATFMEPTNYNIRSILEGYHALIALQSRENSDAGNENVVSKAVDVFLSMGEVPIGVPADKLLEEQKKVYANLEVTPRASHRLAIASGQVVDAITNFADPNWESPKTRELEPDNADYNARDVT